LSSGANTFKDLATQLGKKMQKKSEEDQCCDCFFVGFCRCCPRIDKACDRCLDCLFCDDCTPCVKCLDCICCSEATKRR
jgi:hypothetical protein